MSYIDKITNKDTGESRVISPAAEAVRVSNENYEGENLDEVLYEVAHAIEDAGSGDGTVTGVKVNGTTHEPNDQGVVDIGTVITQHQDISGLATKTEVNTGLATKANDNAVVKSISVNGGQAQTPQNGNVNISVEGAVPHIGSNGNWWIGPETDQNNDTNVPAQGPMGSVTITDGDIDTLEVHNALNANTGILGMSGAMRIKSNIDSLYASLNRLYGKLANMAFWDSEDQEDAAPTPVDWSIPQITVTLDKTSLSANAMITDASDQEITGTSVSVDEGSGLTLKIKPRNGYALTASPTATIGGVSQTLTESNGVYTLVLDSVTEAITIVISATAAAARSVETILTGCSKVSGPTSIINGGGGTFVFAANENYTLPMAAPTVVGASIATNGWDSTTGTLVISNVTGDVTITVVAEKAYPQKHLVNAVTILDAVHDICKPSNIDQARRSVYVLSNDTDNPLSWWGSGSYDFPNPNDYSCLPIPTGATGLQVTSGAGYIIGVCMLAAHSFLSEVKWEDAGATKTFDLTQYPTATHFNINIKNSANTAIADGTTLEDMGISITFS